MAALISLSSFSGIHCAHVLLPEKVLKAGIQLLHERVFVNQMV
jgi:hypothetical protein